MANKPVKLYRLAVNDGEQVTYKRGSLLAIARHILTLSASGKLKPLDHYYISPVTQPLSSELGRK